MPSVIGGPINIGSVAGVVTFGDSFYVAPKGVGKTAGGSGGFNTGNIIGTNNVISSSNTFDPDVVDQPATANA